MSEYNLLANRGKDTIYGMPFRFNALTDPGRKMYNRVFVADGPMISLIPGVPEFRKSNPQIMKILKEEAQTGTSGGEIAEAKKDALNEQFDDNFLVNKKFLDLGEDGNSRGEIAKWLLTSQKNDKVSNGNMDLRYYRFKPDYRRFLNDIELMLSVLAVKMGIKNKDTIDSIFKKGVLNTIASPDEVSIFDKITDKALGITKSDFGGRTSADIDSDLTSLKRGLRFYVNKNISVSSSISNSFGASMISGLSKSLSDMAKEAMFVFGGQMETFEREKQNDTSILDSVKGVIDKIAPSASEKAGSIKGDLSLNLSTILQGANLMYPEIWKDTQYSYSISCSFNFVSPYGSPEAILQYVYTPFLILLTLAMPKQVGTTAYGSPYIIKVDCPGYATSDLAVITSMDWTKGGNENLFSKDGLPLAITVNIQIKDLYPILMIPRSFAHLRHNTGMHGFLDNMAGLSIERFSPVKDIMDSLQARSVYIAGYGNRKYEGIKDWAYRISYKDIMEGLGV